jgi:hypothetical protein
MILTVHNTVTAQLLAKLLLFVRLLRAPPTFNDAKHEAPTIDSTIITLVPESWMMKDAIEDSSDGTIGIDPLIVPALHELWNDPLKDLRSNLSGTLVQNLLRLEIPSSGGKEDIHWRNDPWQAWSAWDQNNDHRGRQSVACPYYSE